MRGLPPILGHEDQRSLLARATRDGRLANALLLHGPPGIGKQRLGHWLAQLLICEEESLLEPCGRCKPCRMSLKLEHPDIHWFFPLPRPRGIAGNRLAEALEDTRASQLAAVREDPYRLPETGTEPRSIFLAQVLAIRRLAASRPGMGKRQVFLIGNAEALVPQEASQEAANALLKTLEEPPGHCMFILTAVDPAALLPTLRSRLQPIRLQPHPADQLARLLEDELSVQPDRARSLAHIAGGSIGQALGFLGKGTEPGPLQIIRGNAKAWLTAAADTAPEARSAAALRIKTTGARGEFADTLEFLSIWIRDLAATANDQDESVLINIDSAGFLRNLAARLPDAANGAGIPLIESALDMTRNNGNPQLILAWLLQSLHQALRAGQPSGVK